MPEAIRTAGLVLTEHEFSVPLDHDRPDGERITVFAREVADPDGRDRPFLVFLQGGPGFEAPRPARHPTAPVLARPRARASSASSCSTSAAPAARRRSARCPGGRREEQADYLAHFRADSIVRDAEWIRRELGVDRWSVLGQSFGGFCVLTYLSRAPEGLREAFFTGGAAADRPPRRRRLPRHLRAGARPEPPLLRPLPRRPRAGARDPPPDRRRGRAASAAAIASPGAASARSATCWGWDPAPSTCTTSSSFRPDSPAFLHDVDAAGQFPRNPLYAAIHEACYADGCATRWSAERLLPRGVRRPGALHRRARLPVDVRGLLGARAAPRGGRAPGERRVAAPLRRGAAAPERGSGGGGRLRRGHVRRAGLLGGDGRARSAASGPGSRTSTSTTACAPTATASSGG